MSRNNSVSTTSTTHSSSLASTATTQTSLSSIQSCKNHIISDFNPTLVLHIPPHGAFKKPRTDIDIHDITPLLPGYNHNTSMIQDSVGVGDIKALVAGRRWSEGDSTGSRGARGAGGDMGEKNALGGLALVSRRHRRWGSRSTVQSTLEERIYTESAEWRVPWNITKPSTITLKSVGEDRKIDVWCGKEDRRAQLWAMEGGVSYVWRWAKDEEGKEELILEKEGGGMGSHRIGWFLFKKSPSSHNPLTPSSGTLILDERGLSRIVAVTSILIFLKRDRQRRTMGGRT